MSERGQFQELADKYDRMKNMNKLQQFISEHPFLTDYEVKRLIEIDRLCPVLVRCVQCRFTCGAQDVEHLIKCIEAGGDGVRDVSFPAGAIERAADWQPEGAPLRVLPRIEPITTKLARITSEADRQRVRDSFDESQCGGVFDGNSVSSDADSGL